METLKSSAPRDPASDFLAEAGPCERQDLEQGLLQLSDLLADSGATSRRGAQRLRHAVAELPLRYAPFLGRLAALWQVSEQKLVAELTRARDPRHWSLTPFRGIKTFAVDLGSAREEQRARLLSLQPGARFPKHRHRGSERVLVLEGAYADSSGCEVSAGQEQHMLENSEHELRIVGDTRCVAAVLEHGVDFSGRLLRWASKLMFR